MPEAVSAVLTPDRVPSQGEQYPFCDLSELILALTPSRVDLTFLQPPGELPSLGVDAFFDGRSASAAPDLFRHALLRAEFDLDFRCDLPRSTASDLIGADWLAAELLPERTCLPSGKDIAVCLPLVDAAGETLRLAKSTSSPIAYRVQLDRRHDGDPQARQLIPALAEIQHGSESLRTLAEHLRETLQLLGKGGWFSREQLCIPRRNAVRDKPWIEAILRRHVRGLRPYLDDDLVRVCWESPREESPASTLQERVARARALDYLGSLLKAIVPSDGSSGFFSDSLVRLRSEARSATTGDYAFISYSHQNRRFSDQLVHAFEQAGVRYWRDDKLAGGECWDEELEQKIRDCGLLVACVSDEYQSSRMCRREIKYADLVEKTILPVSPTPWIWGTGLSLMFHELQVKPLLGPDDFRGVCDRLRSLAPSVLSTASLDH